MKNFTLFIVALFGIIITSCSGPRGPEGLPGIPGPQGPPGVDGGLIVAQAIEFEVDFTAADDYGKQTIYGFDIDLEPADVPLFYIRWDVEEGAEIWRQLPQTTFLEEGVLQYNFDFTQGDFKLFLDGSVNFGALDSSYTLDQIFRLVVVPADFVSLVEDFSYDAVSDLLKLSEQHIQKRKIIE